MRDGRASLVDLKSVCPGQVRVAAMSSSWWNRVEIDPRARGHHDGSSVSKALFLEPAPQGSFDDDIPCLSVSNYARYR